MCPLPNRVTRSSTKSNHEKLNHGIVIGNVPYLEGDSSSLIEYAVAAEEAGWDGVFMGDHIVYADWTD